MLPSLFSAHASGSLVDSCLPIAAIVKNKMYQRPKETRVSKDEVDSRQDETRLSKSGFETEELSQRYNTTANCHLNHEHIIRLIPL